MTRRIAILPEERGTANEPTGIASPFTTDDVTDAPDVAPFLVDARDP